MGLTELGRAAAHTSEESTGGHVVERILGDTVGAIAWDSLLSLYARIFITMRLPFRPR